MSERRDTDRGRFRAAMELVDRLLDVPDAERDALLARECNDDALRAEVMRLLAADAEAGSFLSEPAGAKLPSALTSLAPEPPRRASPGAMFGSFRLVSVLGKGGMGEVWIAERAGADFEQRVAVKLLHGGGGDGDAAAAAARFRRERQILAKLSHPRIARLLDGGVTAAGQPWLAMELVDGLPLLDHCVEKQLDVDARLRLFMEICDAVQFAHRNVVVHRDLKPSNILVGANGEPKLLDFGIAKLLEGQDEEEVTALTRADERPMTPDYASPEQVRGEAITTACDVWALGVILHELLTGVRPFRGNGKSRGEVARAVLETSPTRPSSQIGVAGGDDKRRPSGMTPLALKRRLKGDLDAIVLKALRREPQARYGSVEALATDVRRHLEGAPVAARGDATGYLVRTMLRRHRVAVGFSALVILVLVVGLVSTLWQARRAREEARKAERAQEFLISMLRAFDPEKGDGSPLTQRDILDRGEARVTQALGGQPVEQARLLRVFAETWLDLDDPARALGPAERALALQRGSLGPRDVEVAKTLVVLGTIYARSENFPKSERAHADALSIAREAEGRSGPTVALALARLGNAECLRSEFAIGGPRLREAVEIARRTHGDDSVEALDHSGDLAVCLEDEGRIDESVEITRRNVALSTKLRGAKHPATLLLRHNLAASLMSGGQFEEPYAILREVYEQQREVFGPDRRGQLAGTKRMLARALDGLGRSEEALVLLDEAIQSSAAASGPKSFMVGLCLHNKSVALRHLGQNGEAEKAARDALEMHLAGLGDDRFAARMRAALGAALLALGRAPEARAELERAAAFFDARAPNHPSARAVRADLDAARAASAR